MSEGPIAGAYVEILPQVDEAKFDAAIRKIIDGVGNRVDAAFAKAGSGARKMGSQTVSSADEASHGLKKIETQTAKNIDAIKRFESSSKGMESTFKRIATRITEAFSIYAVAEFVKKSVEVAEAYNRTTRVVEQAIKTTGGAAGVSIERFNELAASMSITTGIAETTIRTADQQLLAFTQIRDVVGKGNDIFSRASKSIQDISVRTGLGAVQVARSLGKALEDPAKASLVLRRASVILTDQQTKQIKVFEKSGKVLDAQKVVLDAVESKFGGAAKAASDPLKQLAAAVNQIERGLGEALLPTLEEFALAIVHHIPQIKEFAAQIGEKLHAAIDAVTPAFKILLGVLQDVGGYITNAFKEHKGLQTLAKYALLAAVAFKVLKEATRAFLEIEILVEAVTLVIEGEFAAAFAVIASPIAIALAAIAALTAGFVYLYRNVKPFHDAVDQLATTVKEKVVGAFSALWGYFQKNILPTLIQIGGILERVLIAEFKIFAAYIQDIVIPILKTLWSIFSATLLPIFKRVGEDAATVFKAIPDILNNYVLPALRLLVSALLDVFGAIVHGAADAFGWIPGLGDKLKGAAADFDDFRDSVNAALDGITPNKTIVIHLVEGAPGTSLYNSQVPQQAQIDAGKAAAKAAADAAQKKAAAAMLAPTGIAPTSSPDVTDAAKAAAQKVKDALTAMADAVKNKIKSIQDYLTKFRQSFEEIVGKIRSFTEITALAQDAASATAGGILRTLQVRVAAINLMTKNLALLQKRHLDQGILDQLAKAGPDQRGFVSALVQASPEQIAALNAAEKQARGFADTLAKQATDREFGKGALAKNLAALAEQNKRLAAIEKILKMQPPQMAAALAAYQKNQKVAVTTTQRTSR